MIKSCLAIIVGIAIAIVADVPANAASLTYLPGGDVATILRVKSSKATRQRLELRCGERPSAGIPSRD